MKSHWSAQDAESMVAHYAAQEIGRDLALRVYTSRLLGRDPALVLHGGGNTSVKTTAVDLVGDTVKVLCVKGSGWDMAAIEPAGLPAVRLEPLLRLRARDRLSDEDMVNVQRTNLLDANAPNPSVETLLHAFLPHRFIDHTHSAAVLSLTNQPDGEALCRTVFGDRVGIVPYIAAGFKLAKVAAEVYEADPAVEGLILMKHGIFSFGDSAEEAYARMIALVGRAEERLARARRRVFVPAELPSAPAPVFAVAPIIRGALAIRRPDGDHRRWILDFRTGPEILNFVNGAELADYSQRGVATPDHVIRTKEKPLIVPAPVDGDPTGFRRAVEAAVSAYAGAYHAYFERNNAGQDTPKVELDRIPRIVLVPGLGFFGVGRTRKDAAVAADVYEGSIRTVTDAEAIGRFESITESELFDMEYWSLEQAKLGKGGDKPLTGQIMVVTGGAGTIGLATAQAFRAQGAEVVILDREADQAAAAARSVGGGALGLACDVTRPESVRRAFDAACAHFGGVDNVVSNAGAAWQGAIAELPDAILRESFELNFFAHQTVAQNAVSVMRAQGTGGALLFNVSKQAVNPGANFGAYGLPKAATLFLVRQYALEHGADGIRCNAVNADRVRSGLLTDSMIASRSTARGLSEHDYLAGNLLGREVTAADVAQAFLHQALELKTTADVTTVDGGNIAAALR